MNFAFSEFLVQVTPRAVPRPGGVFSGAYGFDAGDSVVTVVMLLFFGLPLALGAFFFVALGGLMAFGVTAQMLKPLAPMFAPRSVKLGLLAALVLGLLYTTGAWFPGVFDVPAFGAVSAQDMVVSGLLGLVSGTIVAAMRRRKRRKNRLLEALASATVTKKLLKLQDELSVLVEIPLHAVVGMTVGTLLAATNAANPHVVMAMGGAGAGGGGPPPPPWLLLAPVLLWVMTNCTLGAAIAGALQWIAAQVALASSALTKAAVVGAAKGGVKSWAVAFFETYAVSPTAEVRAAAEEVVGRYCRQHDIHAHYASTDRFRRLAIEVVAGRNDRIDPKDLEMLREPRYQDFLAFVEEARNHSAAPLFRPKVLALPQDDSARREFIARAVRAGIFTGIFTGLANAAVDWFYFGVLQLF